MCFIICSTEKKEKKKKEKTNKKQIPIVSLDFNVLQTLKFEVGHCS